MTYLNFGKYQGDHISQVPSDYLAWVIGGHQTKVWLRRACEIELKRRRDRGEVVPEPVIQRGVNQLHQRGLFDPPSKPARTRKPAVDQMASDAKIDALNAVPEASPRVVLDIYLAGHEAYLWGQAEATGTLMIPRWLPVRSPLRNLWLKWCREQGKDPKITDEQE